MTHMPAALVTDGIEIPDPTLIVSWPAAAVAVVLIFGLLMWPGLLAWLNSRRTREAAEDTRHQVHPNSGKSLRDQTNRIESDIAEIKDLVVAHISDASDRDERVEERLAALEKGREPAHHGILYRLLHH
jgi:hypothetical protein